MRSWFVWRVGAATYVERQSDQSHHTAEAHYSARNSGLRRSYSSKRSLAYARKSKSMVLFSAWNTAHVPHSRCDAWEHHQDSVHTGSDKQTSAYLFTSAYSWSMLSCATSAWATSASCQARGLVGGAYCGTRQDRPGGSRAGSRASGTGCSPPHRPLVRTVRAG